MVPNPEAPRIADYLRDAVDHGRAAIAGTPTSPAAPLVPEAMRQPVSRREFLIGTAAVIGLATSATVFPPVQEAIRAGIEDAHAQGKPGGVEHLIAKEYKTLTDVSADNPYIGRVYDHLLDKGLTPKYQMSITKREEPISPQELHRRFHLEYVDVSNPKAGLEPMDDAETAPPPKLVLPLLLSRSIPVPRGYEITPTPTLVPTREPTATATAFPIITPTRTPIASPTPEATPIPEVEITLLDNTRVYFEQHTYWGWASAGFLNAKKGKAVYKLPSGFIGVMFDTATRGQKKLALVKPQDLGLSEDEQKALLERLELNDDRPPDIETQIIDPASPVSIDATGTDRYVILSMTTATIHATNGEVAYEFSYDTKSRTGNEVYFNVVTDRYSFGDFSQAVSIAVIDGKIMLVDSNYDINTGVKSERRYQIGEAADAVDMKLQITDRGQKAVAYERVWDDGSGAYDYVEVKRILLEKAFDTSIGWIINGMVVKGHKAILKNEKRITRTNIETAADLAALGVGNDYETYNTENIGTYAPPGRVRRIETEVNMSNPKRNYTEAFEIDTIDLKKTFVGNAMSVGVMAGPYDTVLKNPPLDVINRAVVLGKKVVPTICYSQVTDSWKSPAMMAKYEDFIYDFIRKAGPVMQDASGKPLTIEIDGLFAVDGGHLVVKSDWFNRGNATAITDQKARQFVVQAIKRANVADPNRPVWLVLPSELRMTNDNYEAVRDFSRRVQSEGAMLQGVEYRPPSSTKRENEVFFDRAAQDLSASDQTPFIISATDLYYSPQDPSTSEDAIDLVLSRANGGTVSFAVEHELRWPEDNDYLLDNRPPAYEFTPLRQSIFTELKKKAQAVAQNGR